LILGWGWDKIEIVVNEKRGIDYGRVNIHAIRQCQGSFFVAVLEIVGSWFGLKL
jgi:hypothetical protein